MKQALLIIDVQNDYFEGGKSELHHPLQALNHIEQVLQLFRERGLPVIHVQHINTQPGAAADSLWAITNEALPAMS